MRFRRIESRFLFAGLLLIAATSAASIWAVHRFDSFRVRVNDTLRESQSTIDKVSLLAESLEREDDALLLAMTGEIEQARAERDRQQAQFRAIYPTLGGLLTEADEFDAYVRLKRATEAYWSAGDALLAVAQAQEALGQYHREVNPALREAVAVCATMRELNFRSIERAGIVARDEAGTAEILIAVISLIAIALSVAVMLRLSRSVVGPIKVLTSSVEAVGRGEFDRHVPSRGDDELDRLAQGFNRMAASLAEFHRSNLAEVLRAKTTLEATLAALPDAVLLIDPDGRVIAVNPPAETLLRARSDDVLPLDELSLPSSCREAVHRVLAGGETDESDRDLDRAFVADWDPQRRTRLPVVLPIPGFSGGRPGAVLVLYDVTEFARLDELRSEVVAVASHELKTPLTTLHMNLMLLGEQRERLDARQSEVLATAVSGCQQLADTIERLLDLTRIEAGQLHILRERVDVAALVEQVLSQLQPRFADYEVHLTSEVERSARPLVVRGDPDRLAIALSNIVTNALKYSPSGGVVHVAVSSRRNAGSAGDGTLRIAVTDRGPGVPSAYRQRIFEKFFRVEHHQPNGRNRPRGAGIGLYLCRQIVEAHGGRVHCDAGDNGIGTRIAIDLTLESL